MLIQLIQNLVTGGKSCSQSKCVHITEKTTTSRRGSCGSIMCTVHWERTRAEKKKRLRPLAGRWHWRLTEMTLRFGEMDNRPDLSCTSPTAWKVFVGSWHPI